MIEIMYTSDWNYKNKDSLESNDLRCTKTRLYNTDAKLKVDSGNLVLNKHHNYIYEVINPSEVEWVPTEIKRYVFTFETGDRYTNGTDVVRIDSFTEEHIVVNDGRDFNISIEVVEFISEWWKVDEA